MKLGKKSLLIEITALSVLILGVLFINGYQRDVRAGTNDIYKQIEIFADVLRKIEKNYVEPQDPQKLIYGAIKGMIQSLDPHSSFMTKEEHRDLMIDTKGSFMGIGIEITLKDNILTIVSPIEDTPAYNVGLKAGDQILKIDGKLTNDMTLIDAVKLIRGPKGTEVKLTIRREDEEKLLDFTITRDEIPLVSVRKFLLTPNIGYVRISSFRSKTTQDLESALEDLEAGRELKGMVLDLRNNPGGIMGQAIEVADLFLDSGIIVSTKGRDPNQNTEERAHKNEVPRHYPIIVLVNGGSASAAEIVAGALQDNKRAIILGTQTFGKATVQTIIPLSDGSGLRLTTARYYTPSGKSIQASGIIPDIKLEYQPIEDEKDKNKTRFIREKDLKGHMLNEEDEAVESEEKDSEDNAEKFSIDSRIKALLEKDNQVRHAIDLLESWTIFSQIKS
jgi:carboxyl-terminal processing protease